MAPNRSTKFVICMKHSNSPNNHTEPEDDPTLQSSRKKRKTESKSASKQQQGNSCSKSDKMKYSKQVLQKVLPLLRKLNEEQLLEKEIEAKLRGVCLSELQLQDDADCLDDPTSQSSRKKRKTENMSASSPPKQQQGNSCSKSDKMKYSKQVLQKVLPLLRKLNEEQLLEKEIEAKLRGVCLSELQLQDDADCLVRDEFSCNNCGSYFPDFYRRCSCCRYVLCLVCCRELRDGQLKAIICGWKANLDGSIPCPWANKIHDHAILELRRTLPANSIENMVEKGKGLCKINNDPQTLTESNLSCMCTLNARDIQPEHMQHFQVHLARGEPIVVQDVLSNSSGMSWDPRELRRSWYSKGYQVNAVNCLHWSKVTISLNEFCRGYSKRQGLMLEDWQPPFFSQGSGLSYKDEKKRRFAELNKFLPFKDYTDPYHGFLNLATKLPGRSFALGMGPKIDIAYGGGGEEWGHGGSVTMLHFDKSDTVNVLTHTKGDTLTGIALWDIFQRKDVVKVEAYLRENSAAFTHIDGQVSHPIHDRTFYLNMEHKRKLKEDFGVEPWTFKQFLGDAIFIPAGCPYQVRNLTAITKVKLNFISPEGLNECIRLQKELRLLPKNHMAQKQKLNIGKMMIYALEHAIAELSACESLNRSTEDQSAKVPANLNAGACGDSSHIISIEHHTAAIEEHHTAAIEEDNTASAEWRGNAVGQAEKELLEAVEQSYPDTFEGVTKPSKPLWLSILKEFHLFITRFLDTSVDTLSEDQLNGLQADMILFEKLGFNLLWVQERLDMVKDLKFTNLPWRAELQILEESVECLDKEVEELTQRLEQVRAQYADARDARDRKVAEVKQRFGAEYNEVLHGNLGLGILPGH